MNLNRSMIFVSLFLSSTAIAQYVNKMPIYPLPNQIILPPNKVALGERLFHDSRLSRDDSISCATCHDLATGGVDNLPFSIGIDGQKGDINTPTVFNSHFNFKQGWAGRAATLKEQVALPIHNPKEMDSNWQHVISKLEKDNYYFKTFNRLYTDGIQEHNIQDALAIFESSLITPDSPFDRYLNGDENALNEPEKKGYHLFNSYGCISCHQGINIGGNMFQKFGVFGDYFADRGNITKADLGRFNVTGREMDRHRFKIPSLRNVALTAPYFHDGSAATLKEAVKIMIRYQLGRDIPKEEIELIIDFLGTLTGKYKGKSL